MSAFMTSASSGAHTGLSCTVYAPNPPSETYKESARSLTIRICQVLSGSLSLSLSISLSLSLSLSISLSLSLFRPLDLALDLALGDSR
jgi:hypothetical protein